ncbi:ribonuclease P protein component 1 [Halobium salinum]|uniref:Ribonuclease P protein component 1 n=1 Tax=Halobium salinum TaxID=1364940 RepID=A0ABD5P959_9EURY|nr:ribonuclease P protein subunit [Halobium salinum]
MSLTPETLTRHELNGLSARVVDADNPDLVGVAGRVVVETQQTLHLDDGTRVRQVPKRGTAFEFELVDDDALGFEHGADTRSASETAGDGPGAATEADRVDAPTATDEAAERRKASGSVSKRGSETPGVRPGQSGSTHEGSRDADSASRDRQDTVYVTVDGVTLLSRPAHRTETTGDSRWR